MQLADDVGRVMGSVARMSEATSGIECALGPPSVCSVQPLVTCHWALY
jgi:hypothetical protein